MTADIAYIRVIESDPIFFVAEGPGIVLPPTPTQAVGTLSVYSTGPNGTMRNLLSRVIFDGSMILELAVTGTTPDPAPTLSSILSLDMSQPLSVAFCALAL